MGFGPKNGVQTTSSSSRGDSSSPSSSGKTLSMFGWCTPASAESWTTNPSSSSNRSMLRSGVSDILSPPVTLLLIQNSQWNPAWATNMQTSEITSRLLRSTWKCNLHKPLKRHLFDPPDVPLRSMLKSNAYTSSQSSWLQCLRDDYIYDENFHKLGIDVHSHSNPHKLQKCVETSWCHLTNTSCKSWLLRLLRSSLQPFCHDGKQQYANTCLKLWWSNLIKSQEAELWKLHHSSPQNWIQDLGHSHHPQVHTHMIPRSTGFFQLNHLTLEWKLDQLQNTVPPFLQPIQKNQTCSQTYYGKRNPAWTIGMHTFEKWHEINVDPRKAIWRHAQTKHLWNVLSAKSPTDFFKTFSSASRCGLLHPPLKNNSFLGCISKLDSPFLSRGFFHSWWSHIKLSRHSWPLYVEFRLSICTPSASSEPTLLQCSFGGTQWRTLEWCR